MNLIEQWRDLAKTCRTKARENLLPSAQTRMVTKAAVFTECADQLDEWVTSVRVVLDAWDAQNRRISTLILRARVAQDRGDEEILRAQQSMLTACSAELRKLVNPAAAPAVPVEDQCGEGPHGQPCGQRVEQGVCPDHGEVGP